VNQFRGNDFLELIKFISEGQSGKYLPPLTGLVTSIDTNKYIAKVMLQPYQIETGWLPVGTIYAGANFGFCAMPDEGTEVTVVFELGDVGSGKIMLYNFNDTDPPPAFSPGEVILKHKSGSFFKFYINGDVELTPAGNLILAGGGPAVARVGDAIVGTGSCGCSVTGHISAGSAIATCG